MTMPAGQGRRHSLALACLSFAAFGQQSTVIGAIDRLAGNEIRVKTRTRTVTMLVEDRAVAPSALKPGNEISARCRPNGSGKLVAVKIWTSVVAFAGTVKYVDRDDVEVMTSSGREEHKIVRLYSDTAFSTDRKDVKVGQFVRVVGLEVENGAVDAARITIYNTDLPARR